MHPSTDQRAVLAHGGIVVWCAAPLAGGDSAGWDTLDADERARAGRYHQAADRRRSVLARHLLRGIAGALLDRPPATLRFTLGTHGKPALVDAGDLRCNCSHGGGLVVVAFARGREIGVDVESGDRHADSAGLVARWAHSATRDAWLALPPPRRQAGFLAWWTRTEAVLKALGTGLSLAPATLAIDPQPDRAEQEITHDATRWRIVDLPLPGGHRGALAAPAGAWSSRVDDLGGIAVDAGPDP